MAGYWMLRNLLVAVCRGGSTLAGTALTVLLLWYLLFMMGAVHHGPQWGNVGQAARGAVAQAEASWAEFNAGFDQRGAQ